MKTPDNTIRLSPQEILMGFTASCIESVAERLGIGYAEAYKRMDSVGMIDGFIIKYYDTLHTESREVLTDRLTESLKNWEERI